MTSTAARSDTSTPTEAAFEELARAVDESVTAARALEGHAHSVAKNLKEAIEAAHRAALVTIVRRLRADEACRTALYELVDDPLVHMLLSVHGILRPDPLTETGAVLDTVRPMLQSHGGDVELVRIEDGTAYVRLSGACNGCSMSSVTMRNTIEQALIQGVAFISSVEVLPSEPAPALIPLESVRRRVESPEEAREAGWVQTARATEIPDGEISQMRLTDASGQQTEVIVVRIGAGLTAYRDECAHMGLPLGDALLDVTGGTITCPWHGFCFDALSGDCLSAPGAALEQLPLRIDDGHVWIRIGA
jgi:Fe-S cluster biogenesis protein NfuA/nitrite reductase/ring-hydroxylating ferredoxin subunit